MMLLKADSPVYGGYVIARDGGVVFIKGALSGEVVEVSIAERKKDYSVAVVKNIIEPSPFRVKPACPNFGTCGGCHLQFISYEKQVSMKQEIMLDCLRRIGGIEANLMPPLSGGQFNYRHRAQFKVSKDGAIGFFKEGTRDIVPIENCPLMRDEINDALAKVRTCNLSGIKEVHITCGDNLIALIKGRGFDEDISEEFKVAGFSGIAFEDLSRIGQGYTSFDLSGLTYTVSAWTFFQSNWQLNLKAVQLILDGLQPLEGKTVADLYAGAGNFSLPIARQCNEVIAVEENPLAIKDGERNLRINNISNYRFLKEKSEKTNLKADIVVLDPPRPGLTDKVVKMLLETAPETIAYISCNPATLSRDIKKLANKYEISSIRIMDFFPHTYHIESLTLLSRHGLHRHGLQ